MTKQDVLRNLKNLRGKKIEASEFISKIEKAFSGFEENECSDVEVIMERGYSIAYLEGGFTKFRITWTVEHENHNILEIETVSIIENSNNKFNLKKLFKF